MPLFAGPLTDRGPATNFAAQKTNNFVEVPPGFEPGMEVLQFAHDPLEGN